MFIALAGLPPLTVRLCHVWPTPNKSDVKAAVPDVVGSVTTVPPAIAGAWSVTDPDVSPAIDMLAMVYPSYIILTVPASNVSVLGLTVVIRNLSNVADNDLDPADVDALAVLANIVPLMVQVFVAASSNAKK